MIIYQSKGIIYQLALGALIFEARRLRHDVYLEAGYIDSPSPDGVIRDAKDETSEYIVALDATMEKVLGTMRITPMKFSFDLFEIWDGSMLTNSEENVARIKKDHSVELGALAVKKNISNGRKVSWGLYKATLLYSLIKNFDHWVIAMDDRALRSLEILGWRIDRVGKSIMYMGSPTTLGIMPVREQLGSIVEKNQTFYSYISA